jgi:wyosine [tRNA(Phe)-imidazoG37] synthetase (radical SAM superfamily)
MGNLNGNDHNVKPPVSVKPEAPKVDEKKPAMSSVYGPIGSWRFGRALGIDMLCTEERTCNFDCVYCRFPSPGKLQTERQEFVSLSKIFDDINAVKGTSADWVVFAGMGEPTLATNLGEAITMAKSILGLPVAVMTNGSFIKVKEVRKALALADMVVIKLDAFDDNSFNAINRPSGVFSLGKMVGQWQLFRMEYKGKLSFSIMLNDLNKNGMYDLQLKAKLIIPDQIQLNTPRHCDEMKPLSKADWEKSKQWFWNFKEVISVLEAKVPTVQPLNAVDTEKRHPSPKTKEEKASKT